MAENPITATEILERKEAIRGRHDPTPVLEPLVARAIHTLRQAAQDVINDQNVPQARPPSTQHSGSLRRCTGWRVTLNN